MAVSIQIKVLLEGYSYEDESGRYHASGSSTFVKYKDINIIVDTGSPWDGEIIINGLKENNILPEDINFVVGTHGHSDHIGNLNLFQKATHIIGFDICDKDIYHDNELKKGGNYVIIEGIIEVVPTPGHTHSDVSLIIYNTEKYGTVAIAGDLFECKNDENTWQDISEDIEMQKINRSKVLSFADYIIPGHGAMFKVNK